MKQPLKKLLYVILLFIIIAYTKNTIAQTGSTCSGAISLTISPGSNTGWQTTSFDTIWYDFIAPNPNCNFRFHTSLKNKKCVKNIKYGVCGTFVSSSMLTQENDTTIYLTFVDLTAGNHYKLAQIFGLSGNCNGCSSIGEYQIDFVSSTAAVSSICSATCPSIPDCNYLCNGSFEQRGATPTLINQIHYACDWTTANNGSPDLFSTSSTGMPIPLNGFGCENVRITGQTGYAGFGTDPDPSVNANEGIYAPIPSSPLQIGKIYNVSFYLSLAENSSVNATNIGFAFANGYIPSPTTYSFGAHYSTVAVNTSSVSKSGWTAFSYTYIANGNETEFLIGAISGTSTAGTSPPGGVDCTALGYEFSYYYIDDISITQVITAVASPTSICAGSSTTLTASGSSSTYTWSTGALSPTISVSPIVTTVYTVSSTNALGCVTSSTVSVTVANPIIYATSSPTAICVGSSATLIASGATSYTWMPGGTTTASTVVSPTVTTIYTVTGTNTLGCVSSATVQVIVNPTPTLNVTGTTSVCTGGSTTLTASGASTYTWSPCTGTVSCNANPRVFSPTVTTVYTAIGTSSNGCVGSKTFTVTVVPTPTVSVASKTICAGSCATLTASGANTYTWSAPISSTVNPAVVCPTITTIYTVTGKNNGCATTSVKTATVTVVQPLPGVLTISTSVASPVVASGTGTNVVNLSSNITNTTGLTFNWYPNAGSTPTVNFNLTQPEIISLVVNNTACGTSLTQSTCVNYVAASCSNTTIPVLNNAIITSSTQIPAGVYRVTGTLTFSLSGTIDVTNKTFMMATSSKILVSPRTTLLSNTGLRIYSCDGMWNGIELQADVSNAAGITILDDAIIEDAYIAISAGTSTLATMHNININGASTQFNKNYTDIKIVNTNSTSAVYTFTFAAKGMYSKSSGNSPGGNLKCSSYYTPIVKSRSLIGVQAKDAGVITFTVPNGGGFGVNPEIQNKDYGLFFNNTNANVNNVNFNNAVGVAYSYSLNFAATPAGVGIYTKNSKYLHVKPATTPTVGATTTFSNMGYSIISHNTATVDVQNTNHTSSIQSYTTDPSWGSGTNAYIWGGAVGIAGYGLNGVFATNPSGVLRINNNTFSQNYYPITVNYTTTPSASVILSVAQNTISATGTGVITEGTTINSTLAFFGANTDNMRVAANTYTNVQLGVKATAIKSGLRISNNIITLKSTGSRAISLSGSNNAIADANQIIGNNSTSISNIGIFVENSGGCKIKCNTITNAGHGVEFRGNNSSSGDGFFGNTLNYPMRRGLVLSVGGIIGTQGNSSGASANQWIGAWPAANNLDPNQTFVGGTPPGGALSDAANSPLYVHNNATELPTDNGFLAPSIIGNRYLLTVNMFTTTAGNTSTCPSSLTPQALRTNGSTSVDNTDRDNDFVNYINNLVPAANADLTPQDKFLLKQYMFEALSQNPSTNNTITNFYNQQQTGSINAYYDIDSLLTAGNIALATAKNNQASQANDITQTQNAYNTLYINGINNQADLDNLVAIANLCPSLYGNAVFEARALVQSITYVGRTYNDSCDNSKARKKLWMDDETNSVSVAEGVQAKLYPNPNNGMFMLAYDLKTRREATITIIDVTGKLVYNGSIDNLNNVVEINTGNLQSGIYFIQLVHDKTLLWTDKLMINK